jgi:beta-aspartyl-peptidase (threonine type)
VPEKPVFAIHGGAISRRDLHDPARTAEYEAKLSEILRAGFDCLTRGGSALDAVETAVRLFEACDLFDAGRGAVLNEDGEVELDAAIMDGATLRAGAVAAVKRIRHPISAARMVMERSEHLLLAADGAEQFVRDRDRDLMAPPFFFHSPRRLADYARLRASALGTVGAVARDTRGRLAAGTSTGGLEFKKPGRVGDTPIIGAGTYAAQSTCAISCTGTGEHFIRTVAAYAAAARIEHTACSLREALRASLARVAALGGRGGMIGVSATGEVCLDYIQCVGMYRGSITEERMDVRIFE